ncbi:MAG: hypothetical protein ACI4U3_03120 [Traorella sp.]
MIIIYIICLIIFIILLTSNKKEFFKYGLFNKKGFQQLKQKILTYGYNYDMKTHLLSSIFFLSILAFICYEFSVRIESFIIFAIIVTFILPYIILWLLYHSYQEKVFNGFTMFLQTFIAIFKLNPKTYPALIECEKVCDGEIFDLIHKMEEVILKEGDVEACMKVLIEYQPHFIVHNLASLVTTIENHGGMYNEGLDLIQDDIDDWIEDIYHFKKIQVSTKNKMMGLCLLSVFIAYISKNMLSEIHFDVTSDIYQVAIFFFISSLLFTLFMAHRIFSNPWFEKEEKL